MKAEDVTYQKMKPLLRRYEDKGLGESAAFLNWLLENIYRLDEVTAHDAICDKPNDKGIDGIYVDHTAEEVHFFQSKFVQNDGKTIGDTSIKGLLGSLTQFETKESIQAIIDGGAHQDLKKILSREHIDILIDKGYKPTGVFICNQAPDQNTDEILGHNENIVLYDRDKIAREFVDFGANEGVRDTFTFDASYVNPIQFKIDDDKTVYLLLASAAELIRLKGIDDTTLFSRNVRLSLGNTSVNKSISKSLSDSNEHKYFPLYHNGVTLICDDAYLNDSTLSITNYVVVNGAQSLSTFYKEQGRISSDLRVFAKIIVLRDESLARVITVNSNNQNAIKPRDLRSNHDLMLRLKAEFQNGDFPYNFEIKRGEVFTDDKVVISNEEAGRILLAFDLREPYSCHQIYKVFDEKYSDIFGRPEVDAARIVFLYDVMDSINTAVEKLGDARISSYRLTRYLILDIISEVLRQSETTNRIITDKSLLGKRVNRDAIIQHLPDLLSDIIVDFKYEIQEEGDAFDYKKDFKSPDRVKSWRDRIIRSYEKDKKKGKTVGFSDIVPV